ncbi:HlyD family secretion protein [Ideonella margarita]|uniref:HlyD family efflux transporter periplasmic adaptor subunit n=1 Tax=Ideonella margarita TaxID=2984191 RepID=A0ABU9C689_9BURK
MQPLGLRGLMFGVLAALVAVSTLLFLGEASRKSRLSGVLVPDRGLMRVVSPQPGTVLAAAVQEGQVVRAGDVLFTVQLAAAQLSQQAQAGLQQTFDHRSDSLALAARHAAALSAERLRGLGERVEALKRELQQTDAQAALQQQRLALAEKAQARLEALNSEQFISSAQVQAKAEEVLALRAEAAAVARQRQTLMRELGALEAERREAPLETAQKQGELAREQAEIAEAAARADAASAQTQIVLRAPVDGTVTAVHVLPGQAVGTEVALASVVPQGAVLQAHLYAPSSALGFLQVSQAVQMRLQAYPYQQFGLQPGRVLSVAQAPVQAAELATVPLAVRPVAQEPVYRVTVALEPADLLVRQAAGPQPIPRRLLPGMQLEADVVLESRRLGAWLFEPLLGLARRG